MKFLTNTFNAWAFFLISVILLACSSTKSLDKTVNIIVVNSSDLNKKAETVEIDWKRLLKFKDLNVNEIIVKEEQSGKEIPSQIIYNGESDAQSIIFQTDINAKSTQRFILTNGRPAKYAPKVYGRQVPERFDDFTWENDKVAFRFYGEALEGKSGMAKGIDFGQKDFKFSD